MHKKYKLITETIQIMYAFKQGVSRKKNLRNSINLLKIDSIIFSCMLETGLKQTGWPGRHDLSNAGIAAICHHTSPVFMCQWWLNPGCRIY